MSLKNKIFYTLSYFHRPPWDSGITPPELLQYLQSHSPGRVIDLGCGTGTNSLTMARMGWCVTGIDYVLAAIREAEKKAKHAGLAINFKVGDVTRLDGVIGHYELALDLGCFHGLTSVEKSAYINGLVNILVEGGEWFIYSWLNEDNGRDIGMSPDDIDRIEKDFFLVYRQDGFERSDQRSAYFLFKKKKDGGNNISL